MTTTKNQNYRPSMQPTTQTGLPSPTRCAMAQSGVRFIWQLEFAFARRSAQGCGEVRSMIDRMIWRTHCGARRVVMASCEARIEVASVGRRKIHGQTWPARVGQDVADLLVKSGGRDRGHGLSCGPRSILAAVRLGPSDGRADDGRSRERHRPSEGRKWIGGKSPGLPVGSVPTHLIRDRDAA